MIKELRDLLRQIQEPDTATLVEHDGAHPTFHIFKLTNARLKDLDLKLREFRPEHARFDIFINGQYILEEDYVWMDNFTIRNLELYYSLNNNAVTLVQVIDKTLSPMGGRLLKRWISLPLKSVEKIKRRHEVVRYFYENEQSLLKFQSYIKGIGDLERLISKVATGKVNPREIVQLKNSLEQILPIKELAINSGNLSLVDFGN